MLSDLTAARAKVPATRDPKRQRERFSKSRRHPHPEQAFHLQIAVKNIGIVR